MHDSNIRSEMELRAALPADRQEIVAVLKRSQQATGLPSPQALPPAMLETWLYSRQALARYVAQQAGHIVGHCMIEPANPDHEPTWRAALQRSSELPMHEIGGAFVDPDYLQRGIGSIMLEHSLQVVRASPAIPVSATWASNDHVKRVFINHGGIEAGESMTERGAVSLFVFEA